MPVPFLYPAKCFCICYAVIFSWMVDDGGISAQILTKILGHLLQNYSEVYMLYHHHTLIRLMVSR